MNEQQEPPINRLLSELAIAVNHDTAWKKVEAVLTGAEIRRSETESIAFGPRSGIQRGYARLPNLRLAVLRMEVDDSKSFNARSQPEAFHD